jgi:hypothetical protein
MLIAHRSTMVCMANFIVACPDCKCGFPNYEKYNQHIFVSNEDKPSLRMKARIIGCD